MKCRICVLKSDAILINRKSQKKEETGLGNRGHSKHKINYK